MLAPKIISCLLGLALLVPVSASFWLMLRYKPPTEAELQKSMDKALASAKTDIDSKVEPGFPGAISTIVEIHHQLALPVLGPRLWLFTPRAWVGAVGLLCCIIIAGLWVYSTMGSSVAISGSYGRTGMDEPTANESTRGQIIIHGSWTNPSSNIDRPDRN